MASASEHSRKTPLTVITRIPYGRKRSERFSLLAADWKSRRRPLVIVIPGRWQQVQERTTYFAVARALVEDGYTVALPEYCSLSLGWPQQLADLQHAISVISRESIALGGDPESLILWGDGLGAFLATQLVLALSRGIWLPLAPCTIKGWVAIDAVWAEESIQHLASRHPLRQLFPEPKRWLEVKNSLAAGEMVPPGLIVHLNQQVSSGASPAASQSSLTDLESFTYRALTSGNDITLIPRPEESKRIWRGISRHDHPLRITWRPWLHKVTGS